MVDHTDEHIVLLDIQGQLFTLAGQEVGHHLVPQVGHRRGGERGRAVEEGEKLLQSLGLGDAVLNDWDAACEDLAGGEGDGRHGQQFSALVDAVATVVLTKEHQRVDERGQHGGAGKELGEDSVLGAPTGIEVIVKLLLREDGVDRRVAPLQQVRQPFCRVFLRSMIFLIQSISERGRSREGGGEEKQGRKRRGRR